MIKSILIVDDDTDLLDVLENVLRSHVNHIYRATNGKQALELSALHKPDVIICDLHMPVMSGQQVLANLREHNDETPFIILTGFTDIAASITALRYGAFDFLAKPFLEKNLVQKIIEAISMKKLMLMAQEELQQMSTATNKDGDLDKHVPMLFTYTSFLKLDKLDLTTTQKKEIDGINDAFMAERNNKDKQMQPEQLQASYKLMLAKMTAVLSDAQIQKLTELMPK